MQGTTVFLHSENEHFFLLKTNIFVDFLLRLGVIAKDGFCRPFDHKASGYTRSEAICVMYLQRVRDAKRVYANVIYSKANCDGYKLEGIKVYLAQ